MSGVLYSESEHFAMENLVFKLLGLPTTHRQIMLLSAARPRSGPHLSWSQKGHGKRTKSHSSMSHCRRGCCIRVRPCSALQVPVACTEAQATGQRCCTTLYVHDMHIGSIYACTFIMLYARTGEVG